jgi:hypothetical protein
MINFATRTKKYNFLLQKTSIYLGMNIKIYTEKLRFKSSSLVVRDGRIIKDENGKIFQCIR